MPPPRGERREVIALDNSEYIELRRMMQEYFDSRYVLVEDCGKTVDREVEKVEELRVEFSKLREEVRVNRAKTNTRLDILIGILAALAVPVAGLCINFLFG